MFNKIKHRLAKWIWRDNPWTRAVDDIENAANELQKNEANEIILHWHFKFLRPPNKFTISVKLSPFLGDTLPEDAIRKGRGGE